MANYSNEVVNFAWSKVGEIEIYNANCVNERVTRDVEAPVISARLARRIYPVIFATLVDTCSARELPNFVDGRRYQLFTSGVDGKYELVIYRVR